ncbi:SLAM family member 9-like [Sinocyclocheilus anshuiensis]|uniref:SLAM family member 9-like n=1 Tax=Sinocyclocheilus anshuiensis TaxID=1608454 RepID=UPI0007B8C212|nr:PREDICTED: SLAM family member 9-like [Sinocyclocheilus anshuiensis]
MENVDTFIFICLCSWSLAGVFGVDEVKSVSVMEGDSATLNINDTDIQKEDQIMWRFGHILIAHINRKNNKSMVYDDKAGERFRGRLKLDNETVSLSITNTRTTDSGVYNITSKKSETPLNIFNLTVYAHLPVPVISRDCASSSSSSSPQQNCSSSSGSSVSKCVFLCSVVNVSHVTVSWYKGNSLLSSISVSDLNRCLSLHLECLDDSYSCVVNNPISNQTQHLNTELCQPCSEVCILCCGVTEAVIRLALSALVGVAAVAMLVYDIRSRSHQQKREQTSTSHTD